MDCYFCDAIVKPEARCCERCGWIVGATLDRRAAESWARVREIEIEIFGKSRSDG